MFGISSLGWVHTLGSLPAIPVAVYMFARYGRIVPRSIPGAVYFFAMLIGSLTVFLVAHQKASYIIGVAAILLLIFGYGVGRLPIPGRISVYAETFSLTLTVFVLMVPTVTETLKRVPDGHPLVTNLKSPLLVGAQGVLVLGLVLGLIAQAYYLRGKPQAFRSTQA
ncbi:MAG: hypothetical protein AB1704_26050 [Pseudomonadota bacterium]|uniref:hypothetical protein n=1 Tax=Burkholderiaceae TaxID=119060 RepID=UPI0010F83B7B|nr:hypothetical protein [Burkholderia sp. 4M9327F10]